MSDFLDKAKDLARDLGNKAQDAVSEHSDQIDDGIDKAADFVDDKTKHKYTAKIGKVQAKAHGLVEKAASKGGEGTAGGAAGDDA